MPAAGSYSSPDFRLSSRFLRTSSSYQTAHSLLRSITSLLLFFASLPSASSGDDSGLGVGRSPISTVSLEIYCSLSLASVSVVHDALSVVADATCVSAAVGVVCFGVGVEPGRLVMTASSSIVDSLFKDDLTFEAGADGVSFASPAFSFDLSGDDVNDNVPRCTICEIRTGGRRHFSASSRSSCLSSMCYVVN